MSKLKGSDVIMHCVRDYDQMLQILLEEENSISMVEMNSLPLKTGVIE